MSKADRKNNEKNPKTFKIVKEISVIGVNCM